MREGQEGTMAQDTRIAITSVWLISSAILLLAFLAPYLLPESTLLSLSGACQLQHHNHEPCALCGMTRAFIAISRGHFHDAAAFNRSSVALYGILLANELMAAIFLVSRVRILCLSRLPANGAKPHHSHNRRSTHAGP